MGLEALPDEPLSWTALRALGKHPSVVVCTPLLAVSTGDGPGIDGMPEGRIAPREREEEIVGMAISFDEDHCRVVACGRDGWHPMGEMPVDGDEAMLEAEIRKMVEWVDRRRPEGSRALTDHEQSEYAVMRGLP